VQSIQEKVERYQRAFKRAKALRAQFELESQVHKVTEKELEQAYREKQEASAQLFELIESE
jgi:PP-loop superfamily ATP-utilizing enzyme